MNDTERVLRRIANAYAPYRTRRVKGNFSANVKVYERLQFVPYVYHSRGLRVGNIHLKRGETLVPFVVKGGERFFGVAFGAEFIRYDFNIFLRLQHAEIQIESFRFAPFKR